MRFHWKLSLHRDIFCSSIYWSHFFPVSPPPLSNIVKVFFQKMEGWEWEGAKRGNGILDDIRTKLWWICVDYGSMKLTKVSEAVIYSVHVFIYSYIYLLLTFKLYICLLCAFIYSEHIFTFSYIYLLLTLKYFLHMFTLYIYLLWTYINSLLHIFTLYF